MWFLLSAALAASPPPEGAAPLELPQGAPLGYRVTLRLDPASDTFHGRVDLDVDLGGRRSWIWLHAQDLEIREATVSHGAETLVATVSSEDEHTIRLDWGQKLKGEVRVHLDYSGAVDTAGSDGVFRQQEGEDFYLLTQFEPEYARQVIPGYDNPRHKVPWALTLEVPAGNGAFANTPEIGAEDLGDGWRRVRFAESKPLPSYLVAFAVGPFDAVDAGAAGRNDTPVRLLVPRGRAADAGWAAQVTGPLLADLEAWFDAPYPYAKLDVVTIPSTAGFAAMENAGLITFAQNLVVAGAGDDTEGRRRSFANIMAHELAHQWFGNLVTLAWWDDIWLNEAFASWMTTKAVAARWPEWSADAERVASRSAVMQADALRSARRVREPIRERGDILAAFDGITYSKGQSVIETFESWLGPAVFQDGVRRFVADHAWGSATSEDFLDAVDAAAAGAGLDPVGRAMASFLDQPGVPLVTAELNCRDGETPWLALSQERYVVSGSPGRDRWRVPFCARYSDGEDTARTCVMLTRRRQKLPLDGVESCPSWVLPNDDYVGYYRAVYDEAQVTALLVSEHLSEAERLGVLGDADALVATGALDPAALLSALPALLASGASRVIGATVGIVDSLDAYLVPDDLRGRYQRFVLETYGPLAARLGLASAPGEPAEDTLLRPEVLWLVGARGEDPALIDQCVAMTRTWLETGEGIDPEVLATVLGLAARNGDAALRDAMAAAAVAEPDRTRRGELIRGLSRVREPALVRANLDLAIGGELELIEASPLILSALSERAARPAAWGWITAELERLEAVVPSVLRSYIIYSGQGFCDEVRRDEVAAFFEPHAKRWIGGRRALASTLETIEVCQASAAAQQPGVRAFLESLPGAADESGDPDR